MLLTLLLSLVTFILVASAAVLIVSCLHRHEARKLKKVESDHLRAPYVFQGNDVNNFIVPEYRTGALNVRRGKVPAGGWK